MSPGVPKQRKHPGSRRDPALFLGAQIMSMVGDSSLWLATGIWVKDLTGSSAQAALVWFAFIFGGMTAPLSSVLVDRLRLRPVLICTNLVSAANVLLLLLVHDADSVWLVYPVMFLYGVCAALLNAGTFAVLKSLVVTERLAGANAVLATAKQGMNLVAPVLGAGLFAVVGATPVIIADAVTFVFAALALGLIRRTLGGADRQERKSGAWQVVSAGMRHLLGTPPIRRIVLAASVGALGLGLLGPVEYSVNSEGLQRAPAFLGVLFGFQGIGALLGGVLVTRAVRAWGEPRVGVYGLAAAAVGIAAMGAPLLPVVVTGFAVYGWALTWIVVAQQTQVQRLTPVSKMGRCAAAAGLLSRTPQAVGIAAGSALLEAVGYLPLLAFIAALMGTAASMLLVSERRGRPAEAAPGAPVSRLPPTSRRQ